MKKNASSIITILFLLLAFNAFSQDTIVKMDGEKIQAKVLKITDRTVEFQRFGFADGPIYVMNRFDISEIKYRNGMIDIFDQYSIQKATRKKDTTFIKLKRAIKFELLSPLCGDFVLAYEQPILANVNAEIKLGIIEGNNNIDNGDNDDNSGQGIFVKAGLKLIPPQSGNPFRGFYIKPEFIYSNYAGISNESIYNNPNAKFNYSSVGGDLVFGYQAVVSNRFLVDTYLGWGFAYTNISFNYNLLSINYDSEDFTNFGFAGFSNLNNSASDKYSSMILTFGVLVGYSFN